MNSHGHGIYLPVLIKFFHFALKCYFFSKTIRCFLADCEIRSTLDYLCCFDYLYVFSSLAQKIRILLYLIFKCCHGCAVCRLAWQALGDASQDEAMAGFIELLDKLCPMFKPFVEAHKRDLEERERVA
jgi:hypothetical protein